MMRLSTSALVCHALADRFAGVAVREVEVAPPGPGEVRVRMRAAALNYPDVLMTRGGYQHKPELPFVIGMEGAGTIESVGAEVSQWATGDAVVLQKRAGTAAGVLVCGADAVRRLPAGLDFAEGAAHTVGALTAYVALVRRAGLKSGETLLVTGASGGMGLAAVQLGRHLGATVIATGRSLAKLEAARRAGAEHCLVMAPELRDEVRRITGGNGVDVVFDAVGGDAFDTALRCLGWGGRLLVVGFVAGRIPTVAANYVLIKNLSVIGVRAGESGRHDAAQGRENLVAIDALAAAGVFRAPIHARLPLQEGAEGLAMLSAGSVTGKVVIEL
ncbi:MAG: NADPH:quinone oxidoreductase family protein [Burkholderiales bacterium]|nr:NADPH:quinone oxidoreductase family protein [Burkholderiales bacterium]